MTTLQIYGTILHKVFKGYTMYKVVILVLLVLPMGCTWGDLQPSSVAVDLREGVCRVGVFGGGHGSGVAVWRDGRNTYVLTAKHVVDDTADQGFILTYQKGRRDHVEAAMVTKLSKRSDLALLKVQDSSLLVIPVGGVVEENQYVIAIGYMGPIFPPILSLGQITQTVVKCPGCGEEEPDLFQHSAGSYFGSSGGPVIDPVTGTVIGITVGIYIEDDIPRSDRILAVSLDAIREFLAE